MAAARLRRIRQLLAEHSVLVDSSLSLPAGPLSVDITRVCFGYTRDEPVLQELSLRLEAGQVLGVLGRTGIGKSTLAKLLLRLHEPWSGSICLGGVELGEVRFDSLRARVGLVTQEIQLFHASVRDNLSLFDPTASDSRMLDVLEELGLGEWLRRLPQGLNTLLAPHGAGMSAGQAQ